MYKKYKQFCFNLFIIFIFFLILCDTFIKYGHFIIVTKNIKEAVMTHNWIEKKKEIARKKTTNKPKIIFLGGSSTLFGIMTQEIEKRYNIPTVNFGVHAGFNHINFLESETIIDENDIIIIPLEYGFYKKERQSHFSRDELTYIFLYNKKLYKNLNYTNKLDCIIYLINNLKNIRKETKLNKYEKRYPPTTNAYSASNFNSNGDNCYLRKHLQQSVDNANKVSAEYKQKNYFNDEDLGYNKNKHSFINQFVARTNKRNIKTYFIAPVLLIDKNKVNESYFNVRELWNTGHYQFLDNINECFYEKDLFYDTMYHLTTEGSKIRTKQIIKLLGNLQL